MDFELPPDLVAYLAELDDFIEREIKPLEQANDNVRFFDHRREDAVSHAVDGEAVEPGRVYIAVPDRHLFLEPGIVRVKAGPKQNGYRPSIDGLFRTAAAAAPSATAPSGSSKTKASPGTGAGSATATRSRRCSATRARVSRRRCGRPTGRSRSGRRCAEGWRTGPRADGPG